MLKIALTIDDPKAYTRPWTIQVTQIIVLNTDLLDYICLKTKGTSRTYLVGNRGSALNKPLARGPRGRLAEEA